MVNFITALKKRTPRSEKKMMKAWDKNNDGQVSLNEFRDQLKNYLKLRPKTDMGELQKAIAAKETKLEHYNPVPLSNLGDETKTNLKHHDDKKGETA